MIPTYVDSWNYFLSLRFLIPAAFVAAPFLVLFWSVLSTWNAQYQGEITGGDHP